jgi:hypothetical protein
VARIATRAASPNAPVGSLVAYAGPVNTIPSNWLVCDGRQVSSVNYPALFAAIGTSWGGDGVPNFHIPDLRGQFLRGVDKDSTGNPTNPARDPDRDSRLPNTTDPTHPGNEGNDVGSVELDCFQLHTHVDGGHHHGCDTGSSGGHSHPVNINRTAISGSNLTHDVDGGGDKWNSDPHNDMGSISATIPDGTGSHSHQFNTATIQVTLSNPSTSSGGPVRLGSESRPRNSYVYWIIRAQ